MRHCAEATDAPGHQILRRPAEKSEESKSQLEVRPDRGPAEERGARTRHHRTSVHRVMERLACDELQAVSEQILGELQGIALIRSLNAE